MIQNVLPCELILSGDKDGGDGNCWNGAWYVVFWGIWLGIISCIDDERKSGMLCIAWWGKRGTLTEYVAERKTGISLFFGN